MQITCSRCGRPFQPEKAHYRFCTHCFKDTQAVGFTRVNRQSKGADHRHGGVSRLHDGRRTVTLHGDETRENILAGMKRFLTDIYGQPTGISTLLLKKGVGESQIQGMDNDRALNNFVMDLCPQLDSWWRDEFGNKFTDVIIDHYGLYGEKPAKIGKDCGPVCENSTR